MSAHCCTSRLKPDWSGKAVGCDTRRLRLVAITGRLKPADDTTRELWRSRSSL